MRRPSWLRRDDGAGRPRPVTVGRSLRRLRWRLTALYTVTAGMGLIALAVLAANTDSHLRETRLDTTMESRARTAVALLYYTDGKLQLDGISQDEVAVGGPQLTVLLGTPPRTVAFTGVDPPLPVAAGRLRGVAAETVYEGQLVRATGRDDQGKEIVLLGAPLYDDRGIAAGAVVVVGDPAEGRAEHETLVAALILGCVTLVVLAGLAGHVLSGRSMRPAVDALERQEAFLADAAHDLRTPVATLRTLAEVALADPDQRADLLPRTVRLAARMGDIIDDLLTRARLTAGVQHLVREPLRLDQLVEGVVEQVGDAARAGVGLAVGAGLPAGAVPTQDLPTRDQPTGDAPVLTVSVEECTIRADAHLLTRAVANLVENALRHGHRPGEAARVDVVVTRPGRVTVSDHGPGVDPAVASALFDRFRGAPGSIGLGLSISMWAARLHGGTLTLQNGPGATFVLDLPPQ